jgi:Tol biopolymer transport system component
LTLTLFTSLTCFGQEIKLKGNLSPIFDLSPDNKNIAFAVSDGQISNLYEYSFEEKKLNQLTNSTDSYYSRPVYSPKGDKILFLSKSLSSQTSDICLLDLDSKLITKVTNGQTYVTEATFHPTKNEIIFCGAAFLGNYSPVARKAPHDLDIFSINIDDKVSKKITNLSAYELSSVTLSQSGDSVLCKLTEKGFDGIYLMSLTDSTIINKIEATNNPRPGIGNSFYSNPVFAHDYRKISFTAPYQIYLMDLENKKCEELWSTFGKDEQAMVIFSRFSNTNQKVVFSILEIKDRQYSNNAKIITIDIAKKKTTTLELK